MTASDATARDPDTGVIVRTEFLVPGPAQALAGVIGVEEPKDTLPPLWHWVYLLERPRQDDLGVDGHARHGLPSPPGPGFQRLFAGGRITTHTPLRLDEPATRNTQVTAIADKVGRSGSLKFVTVRSEITQDGTPSIVDESDVVYRPLRPVAPTRSAVAEYASTTENGVAAGSATTAMLRTVDAFDLDVDPALLFRFSALTYNAHRIHYDREYARCEGHPDIVVHGPLQALLMAEALRFAKVSLVGAEFSFRLLAPTFGSQRLTATVRPHDDDLTVQVHDGARNLTASGRLSR